MGQNVSVDQSAPPLAAGDTVCWQGERAVVAGVPGLIAGQSVCLWVTRLGANDGNLRLALVHASLIDVELVSRMEPVTDTDISSLECIPLAIWARVCSYLSAADVSMLAMACRFFATVRMHHCVLQYALPLSGSGTTASTQSTIDTNSHPTTTQRSVAMSDARPHAMRHAVRVLPKYYRADGKRFATFDETHSR